MKRENARSVQILKTLKSELLNGRYSATHVFPSEVALSRRFGVSRSTMTFVVGELEKQGFVSRSQGRGTFVTKPGRSRMVGLVVPGLSYSSKYFQKIAAALVQQAHKNGTFAGAVPQVHEPDYRRGAAIAISSQPSALHRATSRH